MKPRLDRFWQFLWINRPIRQRGTVIVAIPVICLFASLIVIAGMRDRALQLRRRLDNNKQILQETNRLLKTVVDAETGIRGYGLTKRREFLEPYLTAKTTLPRLLAKLKVLVPKNQLQAQRFAEIQRETGLQMDLLQNTLNKLDISGASKVPLSQRNQVFSQGKLKMDGLRRKIDEFARAEAKYQNISELAHGAVGGWNQCRASCCFICRFFGCCCFLVFI